MFVLASTSPRRAQLLSQAGLSFKIMPSPADEDEIVSSDPHILTLGKAFHKALPVFSSTQQITVGCDTIVFGSHIYEKPVSAEQAAQFLREFSESSHTVYSGVTILLKTLSLEHEKQIEQLNKGNIEEFKITRENEHVVIQFVGVCKVHFTKITEEEIQQYVLTKEPYDKAGGYGAQSVAGKWIWGFEGDYNSVVGLPLSYLCSVMRVLSK
ncbi:Maf-like_protein [Hexamita inflata]|uniref:Maf-like protein n=1 Tax=Hexamita inflata TaxID=28002 RepID=A0AA86NP75_9EUKA|nr:Maf-like protein [Hexamita inflata]